MSPISSEVTVNAAEDVEYKPPSIILLDLIVENEVLDACATAGNRPCTMLVNTTSVSVLVALLNLISLQFSNEVRIAVTCPFQNSVFELSGLVVAAVLWRMMES